MTTRTSRMPRWLASLIPPTPLARQLSLQSILFAVGEGTFLTGSAVFFTQIVGLTAVQVGLGLTISGVVAFVLVRADGQAGRPHRAAADVGRLGPRPPRCSSSVCPLIDGFAEFAAMVVALAVVERRGQRRTRGVHDRRLPARGAGAVDGVHAQRPQHRLHPRRPARRHRPGHRQRDGDPQRAGAHRGHPRPQRLPRSPVSRMPATTSRARRPRSARSPRRPCATAASSSSASATGCCRPTRSCSTSSIPLWLVQETDAPHVLLAWLFGTNTVMAVLLQVPAARGSDTVPGALRATRLCGRRLRALVPADHGHPRHDRVGTRSR